MGRLEETEPMREWDDYYPERKYCQCAMPKEWLGRGVCVKCWKEINPSDRQGFVLANITGADV